MKKNSLCLMLTDRCNARCRICCFSCSPENHHVMTETMMKKSIDQAAACGDIRVIGFSGGEAFLYYELLKEGLTYAKERGFRTTAATNGFWGAWPDEVLLERLSALPLDFISFSYDAYHGEFVSEDAFYRAYHAASALGIRVSIGIGETKGEGSANAFFKKLGEEKYLKSFYIYPFYRCGRAETLPEDQFFSYKDSHDLYCRDSGEISVRYDGEVFPCCAQPVFDTCLSLGNLNGQTLDALTSDSDMAKVHLVMRDAKSFRRLGETAEEKLGIRFPPHCVSPCEICRKIFSSKENLLQLMPEISRLYDRLTVDRLLGRGCEDE